MSDEADIYRAAEMIVDQRGKRAMDFAVGRAIKLLKEQDVDGAILWRRIIEAIGELQRGRQSAAAVN